MLAEKRANLVAMRDLLAITLVLLLLATWGCKRPANEETITGGGKGGNAVITITPEFQNYFVDTCTIYIKYGSHDAPSDGVYDDSVSCVRVDTLPVATFGGLTTGLYYLYGVGYHSIGGHLPNVKGSKICTVKTEDTLRLYLPVYPYQP